MAGATTSTMNAASANTALPAPTRYVTWVLLILELIVTERAGVRRILDPLRQLRHRKIRVDRTCRDRPRMRCTQFVSGLRRPVESTFTPANPDRRRPRAGHQHLLRTDRR